MFGVRTPPPPKKYSFEIDVSDRVCTSFEPRWANFGTLVTEGDTLEELIGNASVDVMDQDGGELDVWPADESWAQELIEERFRAVVPAGGSA